jgi:two-component system, response regulator RegA
MSRRAAAPPWIILLAHRGGRIRRLLTRRLSTRATTVLTAGTSARALAIAAHTALDVVVLHDSFRSKRGPSLLQQLLRIDSQVAVVVVAGPGSIAAVRSAMEHGASDYLPRPIDRGNVERVVQAALMGSR